MGLWRRIFWACVLAAALPVAALAQDGSSTATQPPRSGSAIEIPEPGDLGLFLIGVAGLVIGRWTSSARKRNRK
jgi:hypothetical protein